MTETCPTFLLDRNRHIVEVIYLPWSSYVIDGERHWYQVPGEYVFERFAGKDEKVAVEWFVYETPVGCFQVHEPFWVANGGSLTVKLDSNRVDGVPCQLPRQWAAASKEAATDDD